MSRLNEIAAQIEQQKQPPVHLWKPDYNGEIDILIDAQGRWFHEGDEIKRVELVRLFASILWFEKGFHYLLTPVEKLRIQVLDVPFIIQQMELIDDIWVATTNTGQRCLIGEEHPVQLRDHAGQQLPYVRVRYELWARLSRAVYFQWVSDALEQSSEQAPCLFSGDYKIELLA